MRTNNKYKVLTPTGYKHFDGVHLVGKRRVIRLYFDGGQYVDCTHDHRLIIDGKEVFVKDLSVGDYVDCKGGKRAKITIISANMKEVDVYDLINVEGGRIFYANGLASHNCEFVSSDETLIDSLVLTGMKHTSPEFFTGQIRWFKEPEPNKVYLVALDPCLGTGGDYAAIQVFEVPSMIQVAEWQHNLTDIKGQVVQMLRILSFISNTMVESGEQEGEPQIYWTFENNAIGEGVVQVIEDTGLEYFAGTLISERSKAKSAQGKRRKGMNTNSRTKPIACVRLKSLVESNKMNIMSNQLIRQLKFFVGNGASYAAKVGEKDDLVSATLLCVRLLDRVMSWLDEEDAEDLSESIDLDESMLPMPIIMS